MSNNYVNIYDFMHICVLLLVMLGSQAVGQSHKFTTFIFTKQTLFHTTFSQHLTCWLGKHWCDLLLCESIWLPDSSPIPCLENLLTFLYTIIVYPCPTSYFLYMFLSTPMWIVFSSLFTMCTLAVIITVVSVLVGVWLWIIFNMVQDGI